MSIVQAPIGTPIPIVGGALVGKSAPWVDWCRNVDFASNLARAHAYSGTEINVMNPPFNASGSGTRDDTERINDAFAYLKSTRFQYNTLPYAPSFYKGFIKFPAGYTFRCDSSINAQMILGQGWGIDMRGATIIGRATNRPVIDLLGSAYGFLDAGLIIGDQDRPPAYAFSHGRMTYDGNQAGGFYFNFNTINGHFSVACGLNSGSEGNSYLGPAWHNMHPSTTTSLIIDGYHHYTPLTDFTPSAWPFETFDSCIQNFIYNADFNGSTVGYPLVICNADQIELTGYLVSTTAAGILLHGNGGRQFRDLKLNAHLELNTATANLRVEAFSAGDIGIHGLEIRDNFPEASVAIIQAGTNVNTLNIYSGDLYKGPYPVANWTSGPVVLHSGVRLNGEYPKFSPGTPAGLPQTGVFSMITGAPSNADGNNGDICGRLDGGALTTIYQKRAGAWTGIV